MSVLYPSSAGKESFSLGEHIAVWDNFFSPELCNKFIAYFEYRSKMAFKRNSSMKQDASVNFGTEMGLRDEMNTESVFIDNSVSDQCLPEFLEKFWNVCFPMYLEKYPHLASSTTKCDFSVIKLQKTLPKEGYHIWHCEQGDIASSRRMAFIIMYLNDVEAGGETEFIYQSARVHPMQGRLILAPASYTHTHRGNPPLSGTKYILTSWLEFQQ